MDNKYFLEALHNFTMDVACRDAIVHLTDKGLSVNEIRETLTYPATEEYITKIRNERLEELRHISSPTENDEPLYEIIEEHDAYGRKSFRKVPKKI